MNIVTTSTQEEAAKQWDGQIVRMDTWLDGRIVGCCQGCQMSNVSCQMVRWSDGQTVGQVDVV